MTIDYLQSQNLILFEAIVGSKAFGLDTVNSDTDIKGVFYMPLDHFYGMQYIPQISNDTNDIVYYELGRFIELLLKNNPNMLELLASPKECIHFIHPIMSQIKLGDFLSKLCKESFAGYAMTQIRKAQGLNKKIVNPMPRERKSVLDFCYIMKEHKSLDLKIWLEQNNIEQVNCGLVSIAHSKGLYALYYDATKIFGYKGIMQSVHSNEVVVSSVPKEEKMLAYMYFNLEGYSTYCKDYREYWEWVNIRNPERYADNLTSMQQAKNFEKSYDTKNMMHTIRLLQVAEEILESGQLNVQRKNREELLSIKRGEWTYDEIMQKADELISRIEDCYTKSSLQMMPNKEKAEQTLISMRKELYHALPS